MSKSELNEGLSNSFVFIIETEEQLIKELPNLLLMEKYKEAIYITAKLIIEGRKIITFSDTYQPFIYEDGIYNTPAEPKIHEDIQRIWGCKATTTVVKEIVGHIKRSTYHNREEFNKNGFIPLKNGLLDINKKELIPFTPEKLYTYKIPVTYNSNSDCPEIKKFIKEVFGEEQEPLAYEIVGYCLYPGYPIQKTFMFTGSGSNGKSTFLNMLINFLGTKNVSNIGLLSLCEGEFTGGWLYGKLANINADLEDKAVKETGKLKMLTGGDSVTYNVKHLAPITFVNQAKMIFAANKIPMVFDDSDAFFRRWVIVRFEKKFTDLNADKNLINKLCSEEELSGLLNLSLAYLECLVERGYFSYFKGTDEIRNEYTRLSDPVSAFVQDCIEQGDPDNRDYAVLKEEVYSVYSRYCDKCKLTKKNEVWFWKQFRHRVEYQTHRVKNIDGLKQELLGIKIKDIVQFLGENEQGKQGKQGILPIAGLYNSIEVNKEKNTLFTLSNEVLPCSEVYTRGDFSDLPCRLPCQTPKTPPKHPKTGENGENQMLNTPLLKNARELLNFLGSHPDRERGVLFDDILLACGGEENLVNLFLSELKTKGLVYEPKHNIFMVNN